MILVDNYGARKRIGRLFCSWNHMFSDEDNHAELRAFAKQIGLDPRWAQKRKTFPTLHFDVSESKRRKAIAAGARAITVQEFRWRLKMEMQKRKRVRI